MKEILWFRRDLRVIDNAILHGANKEVLPIFIFDTNILDSLPKNDKRVNFLYKSVQNLKKELQHMGLDLAIFYGQPEKIFAQLIKDGFNQVLCSVDYDAYAVQRDKNIEKLLPMIRVMDSFILNPLMHLKKDQSAYRMFTPFYKSLAVLTQSLHIEVLPLNKTLNKVSYDYDNVSLEEMGFEKTPLPKMLQCTPLEVLDTFKQKVASYEHDRDYFAIEGTSSLSVFLRFGLISIKEVFNTIRPLPNSECFIKELFFREFYHYILYHFPHSQTHNFNGKNVLWRESNEDYMAWCEGRTGVPIIDAAMRHLNETGQMHNRLRMIVASFFTKNLLLDWRKGEAYFALKLLDYETSSNVASWQWAASTGVDAVPYFRVFNPYTQSQKFDKQGIFIKKVLLQLKDVPSKLLHQENGCAHITDYFPAIVNIKTSRQRAISTLKEAQ